MFGIRKGSLASKVAKQRMESRVTSLNRRPRRQVDGSRRIGSFSSQGIQVGDIARLIRLDLFPGGVANRRHSSWHHIGGFHLAPLEGTDRDRRSGHLSLLHGRSSLPP